MKITPNALILVGTIVLGFVFLGVGIKMLTGVASSVILSPPDQAVRGLSNAILIANGISGDAIINYTIPKANSETILNINISSEKIDAEDEMGRTAHIFLPKVEYPTELVELINVNNIIQIKVENGKIYEICKYGECG